MWHTNCGDQTLEGAEARLFAEVLWDFVCELEVEGVIKGVRYIFSLFHEILERINHLKPDFCKIIQVVRRKLSSVKSW